MKEKSGVFFERGSWYHRTKTLLSDYTVKYGKIGGFKTEQEANEAYLKHKNLFEMQMVESHLKINNDISFEEYLLYWFENIFSKRTDIAGSYIIGVSCVVYNFLIPFLKKEDLNRNIKLKLVNSNFLDSMLEELSKITDSAGEKCREVLSLSMKDALKYKLITSNPVEETKKYKRKKPNIILLNKEQLKILLKYSRYDTWFLELLLGVFCGLRKGEIMGLKFEDFDKEKNIMRIRRQLAEDPVAAAKPNAVNVEIDKFVLTEKPPKSDSYRIMKIPKIIIQEVIERENEYKIYEKVKPNFGGYNYVSFNKETGKPFYRTAMNSYLYRTCPKLNIPQISVHSLRHMFATILIENEVPLSKISALMGHDSITTTFEIYCGIMDEREKILSFMNETFTEDLLKEMKAV